MRNMILLLGIFSLVSCSNSVAQTEFSNEALSENLIASDGGSKTFKEILEKHRGKKVLMEIWASWCSDCVKSMPKFKELQAANPDTDYVFLSLDKTQEKWKAGIEKHQLKGDHYWTSQNMKGAFGQAINLDWIPRYIVIDRNGKIALYRAIETDFEKINTTLKNLK